MARAHNDKAGPNAASALHSYISVTATQLSHLWLGSVHILHSTENIRFKTVTLRTDPFPLAWIFGPLGKCLRYSDVRFGQTGLRKIHLTCRLCGCESVRLTFLQIYKMYVPGNVSLRASLSLRSLYNIGRTSITGPTLGAPCLGSFTSLLHSSFLFQLVDGMGHRHHLV